MYMQVADLKGEREKSRQEMLVMQEDAARREKRLKSEVERLKKKLDDTQARNEELARELRFSEEARLAIRDQEHLQALKVKAFGASGVDITQRSAMSNSVWFYACMHLCLCRIHTKRKKRDRERSDMSNQCMQA